MKTVIFKKNFLAGAFFLTIGLGAVYIARDYPMGSARSMGPGFVPYALGWILAVLGLGNCVMALTRRGEGELLEPIPFFPLFMIVLAIVVFGLLIDQGGLVLAVSAVVILATVAGRSFRPFETVLSLLVLLGLTSALFVFGMEQPVSFLLPH